MLINPYRDSQTSGSNAFVSTVLAQGKPSLSDLLGDNFLDCEEKCQRILLVRYVSAGHDEGDA
jgi:hypothetical protein